MSVKHNLEQWIAQLDYDDTCDISDRQVSDLIRNYAALEARCSALAAENAGLKEWSPNPHSASMFEAIEKAEQLMNDGMPELAMVEAFEILKLKRTPSTDAFLAEVRASAIEHAASERWGSGYVFDELNDFAAQLRKGVQS